jgi:hypothetical protein
VRGCTCHSAGDGGGGLLVRALSQVPAGKLHEKGSKAEDSRRKRVRKFAREGKDNLLTANQISGSNGWEYQKEHKEKYALCLRICVRTTGGGRRWGGGGGGLTLARSSRSRRCCDDERASEGRVSEEG